MGAPSEPAPSPLVRSLHQLRTHRAGFDVTTQRKEVPVLSHGEALVSPLVQVPCSTAVIALVVLPHVGHAHPKPICRPSASSVPGRTTRCQ